MREIALSKVDLNLLVVLEVLLREKSVAAAADKLHLTPSAVSHALKRLRELFGNELLVRDGRKMLPTARAEQIAKSLPVALLRLEMVLEDAEIFDPSHSDRVFRLAAPDFVSSLVPPLLREIGKHAPGIRIELVPFSTTAAAELADGRCDAMIVPHAVQREGLRAAQLGSWPWAVYGRADHPAFGDWSVESWSSFPHLQIRTSDLSGPGPVDRFAAAHEVDRKIGAVVPHFSMAAPVLACTELLLTVPSIAMASSAAAYNLDVRAAPFQLPSLDLSLFHGARFGDEPGVQWFLTQVADAMNLMQGAGPVSAQVTSSR